MISGEENTFLLLKPLERAEKFNHLIENEGWTATKISREIKKSLSYVSNTLRLLKLPPLVQEGLHSDDISEGHARALLGTAVYEHTVIIYREILVKGLSVRETEKRVQKLFSDHQPTVS